MMDGHMGAALTTRGSGAALHLAVAPVSAALSPASYWHIFETACGTVTAVDSMDLSRVIVYRSNVAPCKLWQRGGAAGCRWSRFPVQLQPAQRRLVVVLITVCIHWNGMQR